MEEIYIPLGEKYSVQVLPDYKNTTKYIFREGKIEILHLDGKEQPLKLGERSQVATKVKSLLNESGQYNDDFIKNSWLKIQQIMQEHYQTILANIEQEKQNEKAEAVQILKNKKDEAVQKFKEIDDFLIYVASLVDWFTAIERRNIMISWLAYCSQIILRNPISVIGLGDASSGKSHILETAMKLLPAEYVLYEKKATEAVVFRRSQTDTHFYDGKIVFYGDMGGENDHNEAEEVKNLMKELQTDGYINKPINIQSKENGWEVEDLELIGKPCLTYTTVPNHNFDEQEKSRSIFVTPRMDNKEEFCLRSKIIEFGGHSVDLLKRYEETAELIPYLLLHLHDDVFVEEDMIINPYMSFVQSFLSGSKFYKRDIPKYNGLLKTITALNSFKREPIEIDDEKKKKKYLVMKEDVYFFMDLLAPYRESIAENLSLKAAEILRDFIRILDNNFQEGMAINDYIPKSSLELGKSSFQKYFSELNAEGYLQVLGKDGNSNIYGLTTKSQELIQIDKVELTEEDKMILQYELDNKTVEKIINDEYDGVDVMKQHPKIIPPAWNSENMKK